MLASLLLDRLVEEEPKTKQSNVSVWNFFAVSFPVTQYQGTSFRSFCANEIQTGWRGRVKRLRLNHLLYLDGGHS